MGYYQKYKTQAMLCSPLTTNPGQNLRLEIREILEDFISH